MTIHSESQVRLLLADFANGDAGGKLNLIGGGISILGSQGNGLTTAFAVVVLVGVPQKYAGQQYSLSVELFDVTRGQIFAGPSPTGAPEAVRIQQLVNVQHMQLPPEVEPISDSESQHIMPMNFPNGMPLPPGTYEWRAQIDGQTRPGWYARFHVPEQARGPIFGGPVGPSDISGVSHPFPPQRDEPEDQPPAP